MSHEQGKLFPALASPVMIAFDGDGNVFIPLDQVTALYGVQATCVNVQLCYKVFA